MNRKKTPVAILGLLAMGALPPAATVRLMARLHDSLQHQARRLLVACLLEAGDRGARVVDLAQDAGIEPWQASRHLRHLGIAELVHLLPTPAGRPAHEKWLDAAPVMQTWPAMAGFRDPAHAVRACKAGSDEDARLAAANLMEHSALANPHRVGILFLLMTKELPEARANDVAKLTRLKPPTARAHLRKLEKAGLVFCEIRRPQSSSEPRLEYDRGLQSWYRITPRGQMWLGWGHKSAPKGRSTKTSAPPPPSVMVLA